MAIIMDTVRHCKFFFKHVLEAVSISVIQCEAENIYIYIYIYIYIGKSISYKWI
jgi:hypothetical protein